MTKIEAIKEVMRANDGLANWRIIYNEIERYYKGIKKSAEWKAGIRGVLYREISNDKNFKKIDSGLFALKEYDESLLILDEDRGDTETSVSQKIRKGQNKFREKLFKNLPKECPVTKINDKRLLNASHIKPWALSTNDERLDINNGFLLSVMLDKLFDSGLITFTLDKELIISNSLSNANIKRIGIKNRQIVEDLPIMGREKYLSYHQQKVFLTNARR